MARRGHSKQVISSLSSFSGVADIFIWVKEHVHVEAQGSSLAHHTGPKHTGAKGIMTCITVLNSLLTHGSPKVTLESCPGGALASRKPGKRSSLYLLEVCSTTVSENWFGSPEFKQLPVTCFI